MTGINNRKALTPLIVGIILLLVFLVDLFIFRFVTGRPLGLAPSDLSSGPNISVNAQAAPVAAGWVTPGEPFVLVPPMSFQPVDNHGTGSISAIGYGRANNSLYLKIRLHESLDMSLKKGWGKAFQLLDSKGSSYLYDSYSLPAGVHLYDPLVDLPDDLRANLTVLTGGYKDLYLCFPEFPAAAEPVQLRLIEAFQGNSPANPGIIYHDIALTPAGSALNTEAVMALDSLELDLTSLPPLSLADQELEITFKELRLDEQLFPRLTLDVAPQTSGAYLLDSLLIDETGQNYTMLQLDEAVPLDRQQVQLLYERLPEHVQIKQVWFKLSIDNTEYELIAEI
ncbi:MAG TPA: hypothetical protein GXX34_00495 [Clostridia bacterium]|nr:hypothetical protein [Clostridia bacterium]